MEVKRELTVEGFRDYVEALRSCGDHPLPTLTDGDLAGVVEVVDCCIQCKEDYEDTAGYALVRLVDGRFGLLSEWSDSSGHG